MLIAKPSKENKFILVLSSALVYIKSKEIIKFERFVRKFEIPILRLNPVQMCCKNMQIRVEIHRAFDLNENNLSGFHKVYSRLQH